MKFSFVCALSLSFLLTLVPSQAEKLEIPVSKASTHKTESSDPETFKEEIFGLVLVGDNGQLQTMRPMLTYLVKKHDGSEDNVPLLQYAKKITLELDVESIEGDVRPLTLEYLGSSKSTNPMEGTNGEDWAKAEPVMTFKTGVDKESPAEAFTVDITELKDELGADTANFLMFRLVEGDGFPQDNKKGDLYRLTPKSKIVAELE